MKSILMSLCFFLVISCRTTNSNSSVKNHPEPESISGKVFTQEINGETSTLTFSSDGSLHIKRPDVSHTGIWRENVESTGTLLAPFMMIYVEYEKSVDGVDTLIRESSLINKHKSNSIAWADYGRWYPKN